MGDDEILDNETVRHHMATCTAAGKECSRSNERKALNKSKNAIKPGGKTILAGGKKTFRSHPCNSTKVDEIIDPEKTPSDIVELDAWDDDCAGITSWHFDDKE